MNLAKKMLLPAPRFEKLFHLSTQVGDSYRSGTMTIVPVTGGRFEGDVLKGVILSGSADWNIVMGETVSVNGKYILKTDDGAVISMELHGTDIRGKRQAHLTITTGKRKYRWLMQMIILAQGSVSYDGAIELDVWALKQGAPTVQQDAGPAYQHLYYINVTCDPTLNSGKTKEGMNLVIPITGGRFEGELLNGEVLNVGADWNIFNFSMPISSHVMTRYVLKTDDGAIISLFTDGRMKIRLNIMLKLAGKNPPSLESYYFRQHLYFHTGDEKYLWLNDTVGFAVIGIGADKAIYYDAYMLKR